MDPREFQRLAVRLAGGPTPAERRTSISRCYYAAFNVAAEHLRSLKFPVSKGGAAHGEVRLCLVNAANRELIEAANILQELHTRRIRADYQLDRSDPETASTASTSVATAAKVIQLMDATSSGLNRPQIQSAIAFWRRANGYP